MWWKPLGKLQKTKGETMIKIKLSDLIYSVDASSAGNMLYLNKKTGEIVWVTDDDDDHEKLAEDIENHPEDYIDLPDSSDFHEWSVMERFCFEMDDDSLRDEFLNAIHGRGAFRYFKDLLNRHGMWDEWSEFREKALREVLETWCEMSDVELIDDQSNP